MFTPALLPGIEEGYDLVSGLIKCGNSITLIIIAQFTGKPKILILGSPSQGFWDDVIYFHRRTSKLFLRQTVAAAKARLLRYSKTQRLRDVGFAHSFLSKTFTSCPRRFRIAAASARISIVRSY